MQKLLIVLMGCLLLVGCKQKIEFVEDGPIVKLQLYSASAEYYLDHFPTYITVTNDGVVTLFTEEVVSQNGEIEISVGEDVPVVEKQISMDELDQLKTTIQSNTFFSLDENVTDYQTMDGSGSRVTVYNKDKEKTVGGENSVNDKYKAIEQAIFTHVKDEYSEWRKKTKEYIYKRNE